MVADYAPNPTGNKSIDLIQRSDSQDPYTFRRYITTAHKSGDIAGIRGSIHQDFDPTSPVSPEKEMRLDTETIEAMKPSVMQLFVFIKEQLTNPDHPLNKISKCFVENYVDYYSREILMNAEKFHVFEKNDFSIMVTESNRDVSKIIHH